MWPDAMKICASRHPIEREHQGGSRAQCWAADFNDGLADDVPESEREPLKRKEISVADEA